MSSQQNYYTVVCKNSSSAFNSFCLFQKSDNLGVANAMSVAWLVKPAHPTTTVTFQWQVDHCFVWANSGKLSPQIMVTSAQVWPADLTLTNQVTLAYISEAFTFQNQTQGAEPGKLFVLQDRSIPADQAVVGIGMAQAATLVVQAQPNLPLSFNLDGLQYWIDFGNYIQGQVIDPNQPSLKTQITFPNNVYSMTAVLTSDNIWTINPTPMVNASYRAALAGDPHAQWGAVE